ncbi:DHA2 family methylenomycin A resistance protein-like MFS transporter [Streptomyces sp. 2333.5]|uniref:MFS transporter n=1 Tax=unclassified Streptomyces TaxID=2593676 RepID=UPI0008946F36|nr:MULTISPECIES: MFS transporter [unclassified Streptomyces]PJJ04632.1 DHA2 family methylenomycin A resistance protein-like MFS transporter [Streptomyces sp. 2333.5]SEE56549.1 MFS transporter, DHA2 family, methylenomycin A resistance protein [Streptomyces sp. 2314.4]SEE83559.1 MFS transporter, DHA2 family, methylenomycin A resistance protein [Streptomyces sp. 2112.2]
MITETAAPGVTASPDRADGDARNPGAHSGGGAQLLILALGFVMASLDTGIMNVAATDLRTRLGLSMSGLTWVVDGYVLAFAALLLLAGSLAKRYGARRIYLIGLAVFTAASLLGAVAPNGAVLVAARFAQGAGAALFMPSSLSLLMHAFPEPGRRAKVLGIWSAVVSTSVGLAPSIGGLLVGTLGWRSIFLVNLPIGIVGLLVTRRVVAAVPGRGSALGGSGHVLGLLALGALSYALIEGPDKGWSTPYVLAACGVAVVAATGFVLRERAARTPILPVALFADSSFTAANTVGFLFNFAFYGVLFVLGLFLQTGRGASPVTAGLQMLPAVLVLPFSNMLYARIGPRLGNRAALSGSLAFSAAGYVLLFLILTPGLPYGVLATVLAVAHIGSGVSSPALTGALMDAAGREHADIGSATLNANRQIGSLVGIAVMGAVFTGAGSGYRGAACAFALTAGALAVAAVAGRLGIRSRA